MAIIAGCASVKTAPIETYRCEAGREFSVAFSSDDSARIDFAGMSFALQSEPTTGTGKTYGCSVLTLWRDGKTARLTIDETEEFKHCVRLR